MESREAYFGASGEVVVAADSFTRSTEDGK